MKAVLIGTLGHPGSGKSYFSERLAKKADFFHLSVDKVRHALFEKPTYTKEEHEAVYRLVDYLAEELLRKNINVIYDANFSFKRSREKLKHIAKKFHTKHYVVWIQTNEDVALKRIERRSRYKQKDKKLLYRPISLEVFNKLKSEIELPTKGEPIIIIDGHKSFSDQFKVLKKKLKF